MGLAPSIRASAAPNEAAPTTSCTFTIPASTQAGDVLVVGWVSRQHTIGTAASTIADEQGAAWTANPIGDDRKPNVQWRRADASSAGKVITVSGCVNTCAGWLLVIQDALETGDPLCDEGIWQNNAAADESQSVGITPDAADSLIVFTVFNHTLNLNVTGPAAAGGNPGALSIIVEMLNAGGNKCAAMVAVGTNTGAPTATGAVTWSQTDAATKSALFGVMPALGTDSAIPALLQDG